MLALLLATLTDGGTHRCDSRQKDEAGMRLVDERAGELAARSAPLTEAPFDTEDGAYARASGGNRHHCALDRAFGLRSVHVSATARVPRLRLDRAGSVSLP
jgi:hypothetical protein